MQIRTINWYIVIVSQVCLKLISGKCLESNGSYSKINLCRQSGERGVNFTQGFLSFNTDGLDQKNLSMCACQLTSDRDSAKLHIIRRFLPEPRQHFGMYVFSGKESWVVSTEAFQREVKTIYKDVPWTIIVAKRNSSRDISTDLSTEYCVIFQVFDSATLRLQCETVPPPRDSQIANDTGPCPQYLSDTWIPIMASGLLATTLITLACGICVGCCCRSKPKVRRLKGETPVQDYNDSGIASDGQCIGLETDTSSEYATIDSTKSLHVVQHDSENQIPTSIYPNRNSSIMVENILYA